MMVQVRVRYQDNVAGAFIPTAGLLEAKRLALKDAARWIKEAQDQDGFPTDPSQYTLFLRNKGRESRRDFSSLDPAQLRIPFTLRWVSESGDTGKVAEAAIDALIMLQKRAPVDTGAYLASTSIFINSKPVSMSTVTAYDLKPSDNVFVAPDVKYGAIIEKGFYKGYYQTQDIPGGIVRPIARYIRAKYGSEVACRFIYINPSGYELGKYGTLPAIQIGVPEAFPQNDSIPGRGKRANRRGRLPK